MIKSVCRTKADTRFSLYQKEPQFCELRLKFFIELVTL